MAETMYSVLKRLVGTEKGIVVILEKDEDPFFSDVVKVSKKEVTLNIWGPSNEQDAEEVFQINQIKEVKEMDEDE